MKLPDPLPDDADELEALYQAYIMQDDFEQSEFDRLMEARLRAWGYDPETMTADQLFGLMAESVNRMMLNLYAALDTAPDDESADEVRTVVQQAEELRGKILKLIEEAQAGKADDQA